jgi:hypothetical protein
MAHRDYVRCLFSTEPEFRPSHSLLHGKTRRQEVITHMCELRKYTKIALSICVEELFSLLQLT